MEFETIREKTDTAHAALQALNHDNKDHKLKIADIDKRMVNKIDSKQFFDFQTIVGLVLYAHATFGLLY